MKNSNGQWNDNNQKKLNETSNNEMVTALKERREYINDTRKGRTRYGAHAEGVLGCDAVDYYVETAWEKLYDGIWEWKESRTLAGQLRRIASGLIQKRVKKWRNITAGRSTTHDAWDRMADMDVERMGGEPVVVMSDDGRMLTEKEAEREEAYEVILLIGLVALRLSFSRPM